MPRNNPANIDSFAIMKKHKSQRNQSIYLAMLSLTALSYTLLCHQMYLQYYNKVCCSDCQDVEDRVDTFQENKPSRKGPHSDTPYLVRKTRKHLELLSKVVEPQSGTGNSEVVASSSPLEIAPKKITKEWSKAELQIPGPVNGSKSPAAAAKVPKLPDINLLDCVDRNDLGPNFVQHGKFWILYNYIRGTKRFRCNGSVTYAATADMNFLKHVNPIAQRWRGPMSISLYTPGTDFDVTLERVQYLRHCISSPLVKRLVTFHFFFEFAHFPLHASKWAPQARIDCTKNVSFGKVKRSYRARKKLSYPLGLARNIARDSSPTLYFLNADIELYPSLGFIPMFISFLKRYKDRHKNKVYILPYFEVHPNISINELPKNKSEFLGLYRQGLIVPFHTKICEKCHRVPFLDRWLKSANPTNVRVLGFSKRMNMFSYIEPFYIGTSHEPRFDERFTWEGNKDKRIQGFVMCNLDYEYHVLDNAFLLHSPGIKQFQNKSYRPIFDQNYRLYKRIIPELKKFYGWKPGCYV